MELKVKNVIGIYTVIDGNINVLTKEDKLLSVECNDDLDLVNNSFLKSNIECNNLDLKQCFTFSNKKDNKLYIVILFIATVNYNDIKLKNNLEFIPIANFKKDDKYFIKSIESLKKELILNSTIKKLYPDSFALPEIQKVYEEVLNKKYDRRNFRKRLIKLNVIEDINEISNSKNGRPAKLYKFKDIKEDKVLF